MRIDVHDISFSRSYQALTAEAFSYVLNDQCPNSSGRSCLYAANKPRIIHRPATKKVELCGLLASHRSISFWFRNF